MKVLVDENIPLATVAELRGLGHNVVDIRGTDEQGLPDPLLWQKALVEERLLITTDKGFGANRTDRHFGILIVRLRNPNEQAIHSRIILALSQISESDWPGLMVVMRDQVQSVWRNR